MTEAVKVAAPRRFPAFRRALALSAAKAFLKRARRRLHTPRLRIAQLRAKSFDLAVTL